MKRGIRISLAAAALSILLTSCPNPMTGSTGSSSPRFFADDTTTGWDDDPPEWRGPRIPSNLGITVNRITGLSPHFMRGADISMLAQIEASGGRFYGEDGSARDALRILRDHGVNWVRLGIWNNPVFPQGTTSYHGTPVSPGPAGGGNDDETVVRGLAKRAKALGMKVYLDSTIATSGRTPASRIPPRPGKA